jgi:hypothetical protein
MNGHPQDHPPILPEASWLKKVRPGLLLLHQAADMARDFRHDSWDFAVEQESLLQAGLTSNDLRGLLCLEWVHQATEQPRPGGAARSFQPPAGLNLAPHTCFVLTARGRDGLTRLLAAEADPSDCPGAAPATPGDRPPTLPHWDKDHGELWFGSVLVKRFGQRAANQEAILDAFEEEGWPRFIFNPISPKDDLDDQVRLRRAVTRLNEAQSHPLIRLHVVRGGEEISWEYVGW